MLAQSLIDARRRALVHFRQHGCLAGGERLHNLIEKLRAQPAHVYTEQEPGRALKKSAYGEARRPPQHFEQLAREQPEGGAKGGSPFLRGLPDADLPCLVLDDQRPSIKRNIAVPVQVPQGSQSIECRGVAIENCNSILSIDGSPSR